MHQPTVPPIQAGLRTCQPEPPLPALNGSDVAYAQYLAGAVLAGRDCRATLGKLMAVLDAFAASIRASNEKK